MNPFSSDSASSSSSAPITPSLITSPTNAGSVDVDKKDSSYKSKNKSKDKPSNELDLKKISSGKDRRTTFMIRNIPNKYTQVSYPSYRTYNVILNHKKKK